MVLAGDRLQLRSLYLVGFANSLGMMTLLPTYVDLLEPSGVALGLFIEFRGGNPRL